jgi:hypothetical protein
MRRAKQLLIGSIDEMSEAVMRLLEDLARPEELRERRVRSTRAGFDWKGYLPWADAALNAPGARCCPRGVRDRILRLARSC